MKILFRYIGLFLSFFFLLNSPFCFAEFYSCPSIEEIKQRKISRDFDWTVAEDITLHTVLNADRLYAVSIQNQGDFLACSYDSQTLQLRLDGKPIKAGCIVQPESEQWFITEPGQWLCLENDKSKCRIKLEC